MSDNSELVQRLLVLAAAWPPGAFDIWDAADVLKREDQRRCETCRWQRHESNRPPLCGRITVGPYSAHISCERFGGGCRAWEEKADGRHDA